MQTPPPIIAGAKILAFAIVDDSVIRVRHDLLFVDDKLLGPVPNLAICKYPDEDEYLLLFCDENWNDLGCCVRPSVVEAKDRAEKEYSGLMPRWQDFHHEDDAAIDRQCLEPLCSFCGTSFRNVEGMVEGKNAHICDACIRKLARAMDGEG